MGFFTATVLAVALEFQLDKYIAVRLKNEFASEFLGFHISGLHMFSIVIIINTVMVALIAIPFGKYIRRISSKTIITAGMLLYTSGFVVLAFSNWAWLLITSAVLFTIGELMYSPVRQVLLAGIIPDSNRAAYLAPDGLSYNVAALLGSLGLAIGALFPSYVMAGLYLTAGLGALFFFECHFEQRPNAIQTLPLQMPLKQYLSIDANKHLRAFRGSFLRLFEFIHHHKK